MIKRAALKHWYGVKVLFIESKRGKYTAFRVNALVKENTPRRALHKAMRLGKNTSHLHGEVPNAKWEYVGPIEIYECLTAPTAGSMLSCYKDEGRTWKDALRFVKPESKFELNTFDWNKKPSPDNLYCVRLVYFVRPNKRAKYGKVTTCTCIIRSTRKSQVLEHAYRMAVQKRTKKLVVKVRKDVSLNSTVDFVGIDDIIPIYRKVSDGMELNRTIQRYRTKKAILQLLPTKLDDLVWIDKR